jgi:hypothetical protein
LVALIHTTIQPQASSGPTTLPVTIPSTTAGNTLIACFAGASQGATNPNISSITLGGSSTGWASVISKLSNSSVNVEIWKCSGIAGGQTALVLNIAAATGNTALCAYVYEVSGLAGTADKTAGVNNTTGGSSQTVSSGATATTTAASEFWVGIAFSYYLSAAESFTGVGAWSNLTQQQQTAFDFEVSISGSQIVSSTGAATYSATIPQSSTWAAAVATFQGLAVVPPLSRQMAPPRLLPRAGLLYVS